MRKPCYGARSRRPSTKSEERTHTATVAFTRAEALVGVELIGNNYVYDLIRIAIWAFKI